MDVAARRGDVWTWTALGADTKLMVSYFVGNRTGQSAIVLMDDLCGRLNNRRSSARTGTRRTWKPWKAPSAGLYAQLIKLYGDVPDAHKGRYSSADCTGIEKNRGKSNPDMKHVSMSYVERQNLNMRMGMRRFTRFTTAFSKKLENHIHALALYFMFYNFVRIHKTLKVTPAMAARVTDRLWSMEDVAAVIDARAEPPAKRGPYKKRATETVE